MSKLNITVNVQTKSAIEEIEIIEALQSIAENISLENLKLLGKKAKKPGINKKIQTYKNLI